MKLEYIKETIEWRSGIKFDSPSRERNRSYLRSLYYTLAKEYTNQTITAIAKTVNRDHSTVVHGLKLFEQAYTYEPLIRDLYEDFLTEHPERPSKVKLKIADGLKALRAENEALKTENIRLMLELDAAQKEYNLSLKRLTNELEEANHKLDTNAI